MDASRLAQQHLDIFEIHDVIDILNLPHVTAERKALIKLYRAGSEEIPQAEAEYLHLVNDLCIEHGFPIYFQMGPSHPPHPFKQPREPAGPD